MSIGNDKQLPGKPALSNNGCMIPYSRQCIDDDDIAAVVSILKSDYLTQGPAVDAFESALAAYAGARYAVVFSSGTAALHAAYSVAGIGHGDEVITSPITFVATANAALYVGARPVFVDVEPDTANINTALIESAVTSRTKLIVPVHYAGHPADMEKIHAIARSHKLMVIEDACHAMGARYRGEPIGKCAYSDMTIFSFHPVKHITTGEGGAVLTNNNELYKKLRQFRTHGITREHCTSPPDGAWYYEMRFPGYNYRMTDFQAALGTSQLNKLDAFVEKRRGIAGRYHESFRGNPHFDLPPERAYAFSSYHLYPLRLRGKCREKKQEVFTLLRQRGLGVQVHYIPVYVQPYYKELGYRKGTCPSAEDFYQSEISIPLYPSMSSSDVEYVIDRLGEVFEAL